MVRIERKYYMLSVLCLIVLGFSLIAGVYYRPMFAFAVIAITIYSYIAWRYHRCPNCGRFINMDHLTYARTHEYHCIRCGSKIVVE